MRRVWLAYLAGGGLLAAGYFFLHALTPLPTAAVRVVVYTLVGLSAVAAILIGVRRHRPASPLVWYLLAAGRLCYVVADVLFFTFQHILHVNHVPTVADAFYLGSYPFVVAGLLLVVRRRSPGGDRAGLIDALIVATGTAVVSWVCLIAPFVGNPDLEVAGQITSAAYPVADLTAAAVAARLVTGGGGRTAAFGLVGAAVLVTLASDSIYVAMQLSGTYQAGGPLDGGWLLVHLLWGAAALHPSRRRLTEPSVARAAAFRRGRLVLLAGAALMPPAVLAVQAAGGGPTDIPLIVPAGWRCCCWWSPASPACSRSRSRRSGASGCCGRPAPTWSPPPPRPTARPGCWPASGPCSPASRPTPPSSATTARRGSVWRPPTARPPRRPAAAGCRRRRSTAYAGARLWS